MTAETERPRFRGDATTITVHPSVWGVVATIIITVATAVAWLQSQLSDRPNRTETQQMIDRSNRTLEQMLGRIDAKVDRMDSKLDRIHEEEN